MDLTAPLQFNYQVPEGMLLLFALATGIGFGVFLEKTGFGNARILMAQFFFTDMRMLKVLFSAIVTAMLGIYWFSYFGILDITQVYVNGTYFWPQLAGGVLFGIGFMVCGLCPGTSCVALFTGKLDGLAVIAGMSVGLVLFAETEPGLEGALNFSAMGDVTLYELFNMEYGLLAFLISLVAVGVFWLAGTVEKRMKSKTH